MSFVPHALACRLAAILLGGFAVVQFALAAGAPYGQYVWGGFSEMLTPALRAASAGAGVYLALAALALLARAGDLGRNLPQRPLLAFNVFLAVQLAFNVAANLMAQSPVERYLMTGASIVAFLLVVRALFRPAKAQ